MKKLVAKTKVPTPKKEVTQKGAEAPQETDAPNVSAEAYPEFDQIPENHFKKVLGCGG